MLSIAIRGIEESKIPNIEPVCARKPWLALVASSESVPASINTYYMYRKIPDNAFVL